MTSLYSILDMFWTFRSRRIWRLTRDRTRSHLSRLPPHLADDLDLRSIGMTDDRLR
ncbi:hypothetical protein [Rhizobium sp. Root1220]|uniref:hypothetical protein n=1 Tax=Rhizobium sp. Root1220 TaxID=1736432 RepID=UPI000AC4A713|nr:hypothetical protein [Rhizobium sp. Root1220]